MSGITSYARYIVIMLAKLKPPGQLAISLFEKWRAAVARGRYVRVESKADVSGHH
jgi:hypothetical protein